MVKRYVVYAANCICDAPPNSDGQYVLVADYDALAARLAEAERVILRMAGEGFARAKIYVDKYDLTGEQAARATDSATACLGGAPHWWDINAVTGQTECRLCHKSPGPSAKESL